MAKSIEQKAVDTLAASLSDYRFRNYEFCRLMSEQDARIHKGFFQLMIAYVNFLAVFDKHGWYPNATEAEAKAAARVADSLNRYLQ